MIRMEEVSIVSIFVAVLVSRIFLNCSDAPHGEDTHKLLTTYLRSAVLSGLQI